MYDKIFYWIRGVGSLGVGAITFVYGTVDSVLIALIVMICIDYLTGLVGAGVNKELSSQVGFKGILKKSIILAVVAVGCVCDKMARTGMTFRNMVCTFYIANECLSIIENANKIGLPIPKKLAEIIEVIKSKNDKGVDEDGC